MQTVAGDEGRPNQQTARVQTRRLRSVVRLTFAIFSLALPGWAQTSDLDGGNASKVWTTATESQDSSVGSHTRRVESHTQNGNRTVDKQSVEILRSGSFEPYQDIERESVQVSDTTVRTVVRTFGTDANGGRILFQVTEEEKQSLPGGGAKVARSTLNPDANGSLQVVQREVQDTKKTAPNVEESKTTVFLPGVNGGLAPAMQVQERQEHVGDHTVRFQKSTLLPDGGGNWQVGEVREGTITEEGKNRTSEERVSRRGPDDQLSEVSRTIGKESQNSSGERRNTVESYSMYIPGSSPDGSLHLVQRVTTARSDGPNGGQTTQEQVEQINPGDRNSLQVAMRSTGVKNLPVSGMQETRTIQLGGANGSLHVISVDMTKSDKIPVVEVQVAPPDKPK